MKMNTNNNITRKQVIEAVDPTNLSHCDMAVLKKKDPFMYYSIPGNRDKRPIGEEIDLSELDLAPDCTDGDLARSFTAGTVKREHKVQETAPRRHTSSLSDSIKRRGMGSEIESGATFGFTFQCPSFTIQEEEKMFGPGAKPSNHSRCKSSNAVVMGDQGVSDHRRHFTETDLDSVNLVHRKSAISFESYEMLDDVIGELSDLQPRRPSVQIDKDRRGSVLQDLLFSSAAAIAGLNEFDFDSDSD
jgi:hypothetical protein